MPRVPGIRCVLIGLTVGLAFRAEAQPTRPSLPPAAPAGPVAIDPRDDGFAAWLREAPPGEPVIHRLSNARYVAIIESARWRGDGTLWAARAGAIERCAAEQGTAPARVAELVGTSSWGAFDEAVGSAPLIVITVVPRLGFAARCAVASDAPFAPDALLAAGIQVAADTIAHAANDVSTVELLNGDSEILPALRGRVAMQRLAPDGYAGGDGSSAVRLYIPIDALVTDDPTRLLTLRVWNDSRVEPELIELPTRVIRELWRELLPWRAARLQSAESTGLPVPVPAPRDRGLAQTHAAYLDGRAIEAAQALALRFLEEDVPSSDQLTARMQLGLTFAGHRDSAAALTLLGEALESEPCLTLPEAAPAEFRALLERVRPDSRCDAVSLGTVLRLGVVPGRAQRRLYPERRGAGIVPAVLTGGAAIGSVVLYLGAREKAAAYRSARSDAAAAYLLAEDARSTANLAAAATYLIWGSSIVHAVWKEHRLARRTASVRDYGSLSGRPISIGAAPNGLGLAIHLF